ncbi:aminotransferase class I/II-fold pyridoxal phosphate-dependent enzyme [Acidithiobacillus ferridurans]|uniref:aminotransferase class I/II-fold pyridoxal phosphate-dependent enzyme n=1 Tax=Acidithiobacillus ferridurans TaxID=1232575 RepID=UPI001C06E3C7|nr:8-amino-7-oxononanoate synthase [Acidithiobacillus ferridurans]MBU2733248.1 8-amino-7-oxononanoate synthase [Acidithiobacillus ferridurans]
MHSEREESWRAELSALRAHDLWREVQVLHPGPERGAPTFVGAQGEPLLSFASNDYLGLSAEPALRDAAIAEIRQSGVGAGAAPLLGGARPAHAALADALARWLGVEAVLLFGSGYLANLGVISTLVGRGDRVYADRLNHASLVDGVRLSGARLHRYRHGDMTHLAQWLERGGRGQPWIITDGVFSMDGDIAPLPEFATLAQRYGAGIILDEAHAFGVLGTEGQGTAAHWNMDVHGVDAIMGTLGKAFGVYGAFVAGSQDLVDLLRNRARSFIYHTALPSALAAAALAALDLLRNGDARRERLTQHRQHLRAQVPDAPWLASETPIQGLLLGDARRALTVSAQLRRVGLYCPAVRPPTVPADSARLRITLSAAHSRDDIELLATALREVL